MQPYFNHVWKSYKQHENMASKVLVRNKKLPYLVNMMSKTITFISESPQFVTNIQGRSLCSRSNKISLFDTLKIRPVQISRHSYCKDTTQFNSSIHLSHKSNLTSAIKSSIRSLSYIPPKGRTLVLNKFQEIWLNQNSWLSFAIKINFF